MQKFSKLAYVATLALAIALTLGCEEKESGKTAEQAAPPPAPKEEASCAGEKVKLVESIANDNGTSNKFEYDDKNRIVKIIEGATTQTITYNSDDLVTVEEVSSSDNSKKVTKYAIKENTITIGKGTITIDKDGYIVTDKDYGIYDNRKYQYKNGNLTGISMKDKESKGTRSYTYDDKKSPFSNTNTPKWLLQCLLNEYTTSSNNISKNNILTRDDYSEYLDGARFGSDQAFKYEYDSEGFPVTATSTAEVEGNEETTTTRYTYRTDCKGGEK